MKTHILIGLLVAGAFLVPMANAHVVILAPTGENGDCEKTEVGPSDFGPHPTLWVNDCGPGGHAGPILP